MSAEEIVNDQDLKFFLREYARYSWDCEEILEKLTPLMLSHFPIREVFNNYRSLISDIIRDGLPEKFKNIWIQAEKLKRERKLSQSPLKDERELIRRRINRIIVKLENHLYGAPSLPPATTHTIPPKEEKEEKKKPQVVVPPKKEPPSSKEIQVPEADFKTPFKGFKNKVDEIEEEEGDEIEEEEGEENEIEEAFVIQQIIDKLEMRELPLSGLKKILKWLNEV
jgi:hypothetical protein